MKTVFQILLFFYTGMAIGQVKSNQSIVFVSTDSSQRQVNQLGFPYDTTSAASTNTISESYLQYFAAMGTNNLTVSTPLPFLNYSAGMVFVIKAQNQNTDSVSININSLGNKRLLNEHFGKLRPGNMLAGNLYKIIYNGSDFILMSSIDKGCPNGFVEVNSAYCIEINERAPALYHIASTNCYSINARLCTWSEWYYACKKSGLGLTNLSNNYEFIDDAHDHGGYVGLVSGSSNCQLFNSLDATTTNNAYRCCFRK